MHFRASNHNKQRTTLLISCPCYLSFKEIEIGIRQKSSSPPGSDRRPLHPLLPFPAVPERSQKKILGHKKKFTHITHINVGLFEVKVESKNQESGVENEWNDGDDEEEDHEVDGLVEHRPEAEADVPACGVEGEE